MAKEKKTRKREAAQSSEEKLSRQKKTEADDLSDTESSTASGQSASDEKETVTEDRASEIPAAKEEQAAEDEQTEEDEQAAEEHIRQEIQQEVCRDELEALEAENEKLKQQNKELNDLCLRKQADFENFRKRMLREKEDAVRYANRSLLSDIIQVIDDFERAIASAEDSQDFDTFYTGIKLIEKQFTGMLERNWGLKRMETVGHEFDPQEHEAVMMEESPDYEVQTVVEDFQKGYFLHDRVLRHAKVKVAVPSVR